MNPNDLDFFIKNHQNVLFVGKHGVGKTTIITEAFKRNSLRWLYFSASTMDPWVDFIGVPKEKKSDNGESYLELVRPKVLQDDQIDAIFFDEFNRCLTGDTKIKLFGEKPQEIKDLVDRPNFYVYSYDIINRKEVVAKGHSARITGENEPIYEITLNNKQKIRCTGNHPFLTPYNTSYVAAKDLKRGDMLVSLGNEYLNLQSSFKVVNVERCGIDTVYDLTVDGYHNFALEAGIFVHNSPKKVRNAVMELIQFKSINGKKFNNLKIVWAAVNPDEEDELKYDVEKIDPAQLDRFQVHIDIPYRPDVRYFKNKFGVIGDTAVDWWNALDKNTKNLISPRRLDYALEIYKMNGDMRYVLPKSANITKLIQEFSVGSYVKVIKGLFNSKNPEEIKSFFANENNLTNSIEIIVKNNKYVEFFLEYMPKENIAALYNKHSAIQNYFKRDSNVIKYKDILQQMLDAKTLKYDKERIKKVLKEHERANFIASNIKDNNNPSNSPVVIANEALCLMDAFEQLFPSLPSIFTTRYTNALEIYKHFGQACSGPRKYYVLDALRNEICGVNSKKLTDDNYKDILKVLNLYVTSSNKSTIKKNIAQIARIFNHAFSNLSNKQENIDFINSNCDKLFNEMIRNGRSVICGGVSHRVVEYITLYNKAVEKANNNTPQGQVIKDKLTITTEPVPNFVKIAGVVKEEPTPKINVANTTYIYPDIKHNVKIGYTLANKKPTKINLELDTILRYPPEKKYIVEALYQYCYENLSLPDANELESIIKIMAKYVYRSNKSTIIKQLDDIVRIMNHTIASKNSVDIEKFKQNLLCNRLLCSVKEGRKLYNLLSTHPNSLLFANNFTDNTTSSYGTLTDTLASEEEENEVEEPEEDITLTSF